MISLRCPAAPRLILAAFLTVGSAGAASAPPFEWQAATPESQGLSSAKLDALKDDLAARHTTAFLIVKNDRLIYEWYAPGTDAHTRLGSASTAKALVGGMATAVEITDGILHPEDRAARYIPEWRKDATYYSKITIRELGSHTSGLDDAEGVAFKSDLPSEMSATKGELPHEVLTGWKGAFWQNLPPPRDPFTISRDDVPVMFPPGSQYAYSNSGIAMLGYALTSALRLNHSPQRDLKALLRDRVMRPIGIADTEWDIGYRRPALVDGMEMYAPWGGAEDTGRALLRIGRLMLRQGDWDGQRILSAESVHAISNCQDYGLPGHVSIGWWTNNHNRIPGMPLDSYYAAGAGHRILLVIPSLNVIVVRNGTVLSSKEEYYGAGRKYLFDPLMKALGAPGT
jgi:CubicO group peptidase (beta-lactamase class C family)